MSETEIEAAMDEARYILANNGLAGDKRSDTALERLWLAQIAFRRLRAHVAELDTTRPATGGSAIAATSEGRDGEVDTAIAQDFCREHGYRYLSHEVYTTMTSHEIRVAVEHDYERFEVILPSTARSALSKARGDA